MSKIINIAFAGFRHSHIFVLYNLGADSSIYNITGAYEIDPEARKVAEEKGVCFNYSSYEELLADSSIDVVAIGDYYANRGNLAIKALESGKNVICDKPMCTSLDELERIKNLARSKGLCVSCMFSMRYEEIIAAAKKATELIGEVKSVYFGGQHPLLYSQRPSWYFEDGKYGGLFNDLAIHGIDIIYYLFGKRIKRTISARSYNAYAIEAPDFPDSGQFMAELTNGAGLIADVSYSIPDGVSYDLPFYWQFYIWGEKGVMTFSINSEVVECYIGGNKEKIIIDKIPAPCDYLTDFAAMLSGKSTVLSMDEVFDSTRDTLTIQQSNNEK